jgi:hypothetical protein
VKPSTGWIEPGAASTPQIAVKITNVITRGFVSVKKSRHSVGICVPLAEVVVVASVLILASASLVRERGSMATPP